jgi:hypothetical protein
MRFPHSLNDSPPENRTMTDNFSETQANALIGTAEKMIEVWNRLTEQKQAALLQRFGTQENALAALVATQLLAPAKS